MCVYVCGVCVCVCVRLSVCEGIKKICLLQTKKSAGFFCTELHLTNIRFLPPFKSNCRDFPGLFSFQIRVSAGYNLLF